MPPTPTAVPNGVRIRELREGTGLSAAELARKLRRHVTTIQNAERGRPVSLILIGQLARALGVPPVELIAVEPAADRPDQTVR
ncbi:helix-turn-helix domain-containing protein [Actinomadura craniellae]|nr:helix-turn-helix transcriptional regulator [Actinomadura craniellae]